MLLQMINNPDSDYSYSQATALARRRLGSRSSPMLSTAGSGPSPRGSTPAETSGSETPWWWPLAALRLGQGAQIVEWLVQCIELIVFRNTFVMFARETFDYPELEEHPLLCNHLGRATAIILSHEYNVHNVNLFSAPKLKGRPRKRRKLKEVTGSPNSPEGSEHESNSSEGSNCSGVQKVYFLKHLEKLLLILLIHCSNLLLPSREKIC